MNVPKREGKKKKKKHQPTNQIERSRRGFPVQFSNPPDSPDELPLTYLVINKLDEINHCMHVTVT
jgi:hypothetical protein